MRVVGIVAEYNPLHNGHIYHLEQARAQSNADYVIVVISGSFVQRGEPACIDKYTRAEWALLAGADLVLELPSVFAVSSAERFAVGAVRTLNATGVVSDLAFGCEERDVRMLSRLSTLLSNEPDAYREALKFHLSEGKSFPRARYEALYDYGVPEEMLYAVAQPNNILAIEYLNALSAYAPNILPLPIARIACGYSDVKLSGEISSATAIRAALHAGNRDVLSAMPSFVGGRMFYDDSFPLLQSQFSDMILYALRRMTTEQLRELPDVGEGFENVLYRAVRSVDTADALFESVKSKRYTLARCKRIAVSALLGITLTKTHELMRSPEGTYLHVLGFRKSARSLLAEIGKQRFAPMVIRNADISACPPALQASLETDFLATDLVRIASKKELHRDTDGAIQL